MIKKTTTTVLALLFCVVHAVMLSAQMTDAEIITYAKQAISSGQSTESIVKELAARGVTYEQATRIKATLSGSTGTIKVSPAAIAA